MFNKKAQLGGLQTLVMTLIVVGLVLGIGFLILEEFKALTNVYKGTVSGERILAVTRTGKTVAKNTSSVECFNSFAVTSVINSTSATAIDAANYSYNADTGLVYSITNGLYNNTNWNVTYTYQYGKGACTGITAAITAENKIPAWLSIIVILVIVGILLAIVFTVLPRYSSGGGTTAEI